MQTAHFNQKNGPKGKREFLTKEQKDLQMDLRALVIAHNYRERTAHLGEAVLLTMPNDHFIRRLTSRIDKNANYVRLFEAFVEYVPNNRSRFLNFSFNEEIIVRINGYDFKSAINVARAEPEDAFGNNVMLYVSTVTSPKDKTYHPPSRTLWFRK